MKREWLLVSGILLLAILLRLWNLGGRPFWYDEAFAQLYAELPLTEMIAGTITTENGAAADVHPVFYYSVLHAWMALLGSTPFAVRLLSALLGAATAGIGVLLGAALFDRRTGLIWGLLIAISPFAIYYSQELRMYALLGFAALSAVYFFVRAWQLGKWWRWALFAILWRGDHVRAQFGNLVRRRYWAVGAVGLGPTATAGQAAPAGGVRRAAAAALSTLAAGCTQPAAQDPASVLGHPP